MRVEERLRELGLVLPARVQPPPGVRLPFAPVRIVGDRACVSGHGPQNPDGSIAGPFGKVGAEISVEQGYAGSQVDGPLHPGQPRARAGGSRPHHRVGSGLRDGQLGSGVRKPALRANGFSDLILELYGDAGVHARSAVGMAELPFNMPVEIEAEVRIAP
jgi:hypothetical protein